MSNRSGIAVLIMVALGLSAPVFVHSEEAEGRPIKYVRGRISSTDYAGSKVAIQWFFTTGKVAQDKMTFFVPDKATVLTDKRKIFKAVRDTGVVDLVVGDHVIVEYYDDNKMGYPEAISIRVLEHDRPTPPP